MLTLSRKLMHMETFRETSGKGLPDWQAVAWARLPPAPLCLSVCKDSCHLAPLSAVRFSQGLCQWPAWACPERGQHEAGKAPPGSAAPTEAVGSLPACT